MKIPTFPAGSGPGDLVIHFAPEASGRSILSQLLSGAESRGPWDLPGSAALEALIREARAAGSSSSLDLGFRLRAHLERHAPELAAAIAASLAASRPRIVLTGDPCTPALSLPWESYGSVGDQPFLDGRAQLVRLLEGVIRSDLALAVDERLVVSFVVGDLDQIGGPAQTSATEHRIRDALGAALDALAEWPGQVSVRVVACGAAAAAFHGHASDRRFASVQTESADERLEQLVRKTARDSHVVHWIGHSDATADKPATSLCARDAAGAQQPIALADFASWVGDEASKVRLLVLHSCWTDAAGAASLLTHVPQLVALQALPTLDSVEPFHRALYGVLTQPQRGGVAAAVAELRRALDVDIGWIPVHYTTQLASAGLVDVDRQRARSYDVQLVGKLDALSGFFDDLLKGGRVRSRVFVGLDLHGADDVSSVEDPMRMVEHRLEARHESQRDTLTKIIARARSQPQLRRLVLRGDAGQGKTTLLKDAGCEFVRAGWTVVFARVADLISVVKKKHDGDKLETRSVLAQKNGALAVAPGLSHSRAKAAIDRGQFLLLLDGLDEVPARLHAGVIDALLTVDQDLGDGVVVVASRRSTHDKAPAPYREVRIAGLSPEDKRDIVGKWYAELWHHREDPLRFAPLRSHWTSPAAATTAFVDALRGHPPLDQTTNDPLSLTLAALWFAEKGGKIARDASGAAASFQRRDVLRQFVDGLLSARHREEAHRPFGADLHLARVGARFLALWMLEHGQGRRIDLGEDVEDLHEGNAIAGAMEAAITDGHDGALIQWRKLFVGKGGDPAEAWQWSRGDAQPSSFVLALQRTDLFVPIDSSRRVWHFPLASLQDVLAAEALAVRAGLADVRGQAQPTKDGATRIDGLIVELRAMFAQDPGRVAALGETLALLEAWILDETAKTAWIVGLHAIDAQLGLRALGFAHQPPAAAVRELLEKANAAAKLDFWDGFVRRVDDAKLAVAVLRAAVPSLSSGVDRFCIDEELIALGGRPGANGVKHRSLMRAVRRGRTAASTDLSALTHLPCRPNDGLWRHIAPQLIKWKDATLGVGDELKAVPVPQPFWMMAVAVTVKMYRLFDHTHAFEWCGQTRTIHQAPPYDPRSVEDERNSRLTAAHPAIAGWFEAVAFTRWLNEVLLPRVEELLGISAPADWRFRLPTELEWEWACRAGTTTAFSCGEKLTAKHAWFGEGYNGAAHPVGLLTPNGFGLRDMHGNVYEWCVDAWDSSVEASGRLGGRGSGRVARGGSCRNGAGRCRSAIRGRCDPALRFVDYVGFRPVLAAPLPSSGSVIEDR